MSLTAAIDNERRCPSTFALERLRQGELLGSEEARRLEEHLDGCRRCQGRRERIVAAVAPRWEGFPEPAARFRSRDRWVWARRWLLGPCLAATVAVIVIFGRPDSEERSKGGGVQLRVHVRHLDGRTEVVSAGATLVPGERLRFEVSSPQDAHVAVISLDAQGKITPFLPMEGQALAHPARKTIVYPQAIELDDTMGPERLILFTCARPTQVGAVVKAVRTATSGHKVEPTARLDISIPCTQETFWFDKRRAR